jgi:hypothetical protein
MQEERQTKKRKKDIKKERKKERKEGWNKEWKKESLMFFNNLYNSCTSVLNELKAKDKRPGRNLIKLFVIRPNFQIHPKTKKQTLKLGKQFYYNITTLHFKVFPG